MFLVQDRAAPNQRSGVQHEAKACADCKFAAPTQRSRRIADVPRAPCGHRPPEPAQALREAPSFQPPRERPRPPRVPGPDPPRGVASAAARPGPWAGPRDPDHPAQPLARPADRLARRIAVRKWRESTALQQPYRHHHHQGCLFPLDFIFRGGFTAGVRQVAHHHSPTTSTMIPILGVYIYVYIYMHHYAK